MKFGKQKKKPATDGKTTERQALTLVLESSTRAMHATDYDTGIRTWTAVLMPAFRALNIAPPYFRNLMPRLKGLSEDPAKSAPTRDLAHQAYHAAGRAGEHLMNLTDEEANRATAAEEQSKPSGAKRKTGGRKAAKRGAYPDDERLARAMVDAALKEQIDGLEREAEAAAKSGRASEADTLRRRRLVYQAEHDQRRKPSPRERKIQAASAAVPKAPKPKRAKKP